MNFFQYMDAGNL